MWTKQHVILLLGRDPMSPVKIKASHPLKLIIDSHLERGLFGLLKYSGQKSDACLAGGNVFRLKSIL